MIILDTNYGQIKLQLDEEKTPETAKNFYRYVDEGFYDGTIFHRVIDNFMIQGGGFDQDMNRKDTHLAIDNEADKGLKNARGTIAMARTMDPNSATSQFFINVKDNGFLDHTAKSREGWGYCAFGEVIEGMDIVDKIKAVDTGTQQGHQDVPNEPVIIEKAYRADAE